MDKFTNSLYKGCYKILKYLIFFFVLLLAFSALLYTTYIADMGSQIMLTKADNILFSLLGLALFLLVLWGIQKHAALCYKILLPLTLLWYLAGGAVLILFSRSAPAADAMTVYTVAESFASGNMAAIHPTDSYLSYYPHQIGLIAYYEVALRFWNLLPISMEGFHFIKLLNVLWACVLIFFQNKTLQLLFHDVRVNASYLLLMLLNLPLLIYTSFVYGEIPSLACFSLGLWALLKVLSLPDRSAIAYSLLSFLSFVLCIMLRKNAMILLIAVIAVVLFEGLRRKRFSLLLHGVIYACIMFLTLPAVQQYYEHRAENYLSRGVTALSYFAMGMQESTRAEGWYNGFNFNTYQETGLSTEASNTLSKAAIAERLEYFRENPDQLWRFYRNKFRSQWCDGTYASLQATVSNLGGRREFFNKLYDGTYDAIWLPYCNLLQNLLYIGALFFAFVQLRRKETCQGFPVYICIIGAFGGFLFHMLWEANSRYIFPYSLLLYPYAAYGFTQLLQILSTKRKTGKI